MDFVCQEDFGQRIIGHKIWVTLTIIDEGYIAPTNIQGPDRGDRH
jgi:hypothetical protein